MAKATVKKMKKVEEDYKSLPVRYKEAKCEIETMNGELTETYSKIRFLELEVVQANAKIERVSMKKLDNVISSQKHFSDKSGLGYTGGSSSSANVTKEMKFVKAKEPVVVAPIPEKIKDEKKKNGANQRVLNKPCTQTVVMPKVQGKSPLSLQRGPRIQHFCHFCGLQGHIRPNFHKLKALKNASVQRSKSPKNDKRSWAGEQSRSRNGDLGVMDVMTMIGAFTTCLENFTRRFESPNSRTQSFRDITLNTRVMWVKRGTHA